VLRDFNRTVGTYVKRADALTASKRLGSGRMLPSRTSFRGEVPSDTL